MSRLLALFDIDKTMTEVMSFLPMLETQDSEGLVVAGSAALAREVELSYQYGIVAYEDYVKSLLDIYAWALQDRHVDEVTESTDRFFEQNSDFYGYVGPTMELLNPTHDVALVTSNTQFAASAVAKIYGVDNFCSTVFASEGGKLNGRVASYLANRHAKRQAIQHLIETHPYEGSFAFADSEGDIEILRAVEHPICIKPDSGLRSVAESRGWEIIDSVAELNSKIGLTVVRSVLGEIL